MLLILFLSDQIHCSVKNETRKSALGSLLFHAGEQRWGEGGAEKLNQLEGFSHAPIS